jgi:hypothetical protein
MLLRYRMERRMEAPGSDALSDDVRWHDELFTHNEIPTDRLKDVYLEAMSHHGQYPLKPNDYVDAWRRLQPKEGDGADLRPMGARGSDCAICEGKGMTTIYDPKTDADIEKECPYHCKVVTAIERQTGTKVSRVA